MTNFGTKGLCRIDRNNVWQADRLRRDCSLDEVIDISFYKTWCRHYSDRPSRFISNQSCYGLR